MEMMDVYNEEFEKTGKVVGRAHKNLSPGERFLMVDIFLYNDKNEFLIQKRASIKKWMPNIWDITGGAVSSGETSFQAAFRETKEELGIDIKENDIKLLAHLKTPRSYVDIYIAKIDFTIEDLVLKIDEVSEAKFVTKEELKNMLLSSYHRPMYNEAVLEYIDRNFK